MEIAVATSLARDLLLEELTNLKSLLRLNADGVGDEADLIYQLNQTRGAIDQFSTTLSEKRDLLATPGSLSPTSPVSSNRTSPRLSLESLQSWRSSRTSGFSWHMDSENTRNFGASLRSHHLTESVGQRDGHKELELENGNTEFPANRSNADEAMDEDGDAQDETFKRLSVLLASLQAQAEAAVSAPATPLRNDENKEANFVEDTIFRFPGSAFPISRPKKASALQPSELQSSRPALFRAAFRRSKSLPYSAFSCARTGSLSSIPDAECAPTTSEVGTGGEADEDSDTHAYLPSPYLVDPNFSDTFRPHSLHRRSTCSSLPNSTANTPPLSATLLPLSPAIPTPPCSSSRRSSIALSRRSSALIKDLGIDALLGDLLDVVSKAEEDRAFMGWIWGLLTGGGVLWFTIGLALKWNCDCTRDSG